MSFGGSRIDVTVATEILRAVEPLAVEAALEAERMRVDSEAERQSDGRARRRAGPLRGGARRAPLRRVRSGPQAPPPVTLGWTNACPWFSAGDDNQ